MQSSSKIFVARTYIVVHSEVRDSYMLDILTSIIETSHLNLPMYGGCWVGDKRPGVNVPGWSREVKAFRDKSLYWGNFWRQAGRPVTGWIHQVYTDARREYHQAVLMVKRERKKHQAEELLVAAMEGDIHLLKAMKSIRRGKNAGNSELPDSVGGVMGEQNIAELFKESYENLFNSAPTGDEMHEMKAKLEDLIGVGGQQGNWWHYQRSCC